MSDWQPIEAAPKDGTRVDVWVPGRGRITDAAYQKHDHVPLYGWFHPIPHDPEWPMDGREPIEPTHWMPVPTPPETET